MEDVFTKYGYIYKVTNKINHKIYVGKKVGGVFDENYWGSGTKLKNALKEFGVHNFEKEIIEWCSTKDVLKEREKYWVDKLNSRDPNIGYNIKKGPIVEERNEVEGKGGIIVSLQIPEDTYYKLKEIAKEECTSVSYLIRKALIKTIREDNE